MGWAAAISAAVLQAFTRARVGTRRARPALPRSRPRWCLCGWSSARVAGSSYPASGGSAASSNHRRGDRATSKGFNERRPFPGAAAPVRRDGPPRHPGAHRSADPRSGGLGRRSPSRATVARRASKSATGPSGYGHAGRVPEVSRAHLCRLPEPTRRRAGPPGETRARPLPIGLRECRSRGRRDRWRVPGEEAFANGSRSVRQGARWSGAPPAASTAARPRPLAAAATVRAHEVVGLRLGHRDLVDVGLDGSAVAEPVERHDRQRG